MIFTGNKHELIAGLRRIISCNPISRLIGSDVSIFSWNFDDGWISLKLSHEILTMKVVHIVFWSTDQKETFNMLEEFLSSIRRLRYDQLLLTWCTMQNPLLIAEFSVPVILEMRNIEFPEIKESPLSWYRIAQDFSCWYENRLISDLSKVLPSSSSHKSFIFSSDVLWRKIKSLFGLSLI